MFSKDKLPVFVQKCAFLDTMALFFEGGEGGTDVGGRLAERDSR